MIRGLPWRPRFWAPLLVGLATATAGAYTHFTHYRSGQGFANPIVEKFDLDALVDQTVYFYVAKDGPRLAVNDTYEALVSHVRQALSVWDAVPTSSLRVAYGGLTEGLPEDAPPAGEILFAELGPGVIGLGGPITWGEAQGDHIPIIRSQVILSNDLTSGSRPRQSFSELFFSSLVHEIGHALGLQHTLTSSVMSTDITRATSRSQPLGADDIAGLSALYPTARFREIHGSVSGRVQTVSGDPVHLASVVAIGAAGTAVSALTAPDGTYRIEGVLPGPYRVYAHPLPPATQQGLGPANVVLPELDGGATLEPSGPFKTVFLGGATDLGQTPLVEVRAGNASQADFQVQPVDQLQLHGITTYSYPGNGAPGVHPAFLDQTQDASYVVAAGEGLAENLADLTVEALGPELRPRKPRAYGSNGRFVRLDFDIEPYSLPGPKHLLFRLPGDIYVLPKAVNLTSRPAPVIYWVDEAPSATQDGVYSVHGINFSPLSTVYFDGLPAEIVGVNSDGNEIDVRPPAAPPGHRAIVTVYNPDGQSSALTLPDGNVIFNYAGGATPMLTLGPAYLHAGTDRVIEIKGQGVEFVPGDTVVGFGSSDVLARLVEVVSPTHLRAVVSVPAESTSGNYLVTVTSGLAVMTLSQRLGTGSAPITNTSGRPELRFNGVINSATMTHELSPGVVASVFGRNLAPPSTSANSPLDAAAVRVTFDGLPAVLFGATTGQLNVQIPPSLEPGIAEMKISVGDSVGEPMLVELGRVSPGVFRIVRQDNSQFDASSTARRGEMLALVATGLGSTSLSSSIAESPAAAPILVEVGGARYKPEAVEPVAGAPGIYRILFSVPQAVLAGETTAALWVDGHQSNRVALTVAR